MKIAKAPVEGRYLETFLYRILRPLAKPCQPTVSVTRSAHRQAHTFEDEDQYLLVYFHFRCLAVYSLVSMVILKCQVE